MYSFYFYDAYHRHNYLLNFRQKLGLFSDIYFCMDIIMGMVKKDILPTYFGSNWSRATNKVAETSTERGCQSKWWQK